MPPQNAIGTRSARQVSPRDWMSTFVSRPRTVVTCGAPDRTSRQTGALFKGCVASRLASAAADAFSGVGAGVGIWADAMPAERINACLLYTSDAADEEDSVDLGGRRIIKKKKK